MFWILTLIGQIWLGIELFLPIFQPEFNLFTTIGSVCLLGPCVSTLIFFIFSYVFGFNLLHVVIHTFLLLIISFYLNKRRRKQFDYFFSESTIKFAVPLITFILSFLFIFPPYLPFSDLYISSMRISLHEEFSLQASFIYGRNKDRSHFFLIDHPDFFGKHAVSQWLTSCHMSMFRIGFCGIRTSLFIDLFVFLNSFFLVLFSFGDDFLLPMYISPFMIFLPFFISGFGYSDFQRDCDKLNICNSVNSHTDYVSYFHPNYKHITFLHPILHLSIGNIPVLLSLGLCTLTFQLLYRSICCRTNVRLLMLTGFIIGGILPCVHYQAFYLMFVFSTLNVLFQLWRQNKNYVNQTLYFFSSLLISFFVLNSVRYFDDNYLFNSISFKKIYNFEIENGEIFAFFKYWYHACGYYALILFSLCWFVFYIIEKQFTFVYCVTFLLFNCIQTHKNDMESYCLFYLMLFTYGCIVFTTSIHRISMKLMDYYYLHGVCGGVFFVLTILCSVSVIMSATIQLSEWDVYWDEKATEVSTWIIKNTPPKSVFLSNRLFNDPIVSLAGRSVYLVNSNLSAKLNFDYTERKTVVTQFVENQTNLLLIKDVDYIAVWSHDYFLHRNFKVNENWTLVYNHHEICRIYKKTHINLF